MGWPYLLVGSVGVVLILVALAWGIIESRKAPQESWIDQRRF